METKGTRIPAERRTGIDRLSPARLPPRRWWGVIVFFISGALASMLPGCVTQDPTTLIGPCRGGRFQECPIGLGEYKPVQQRVGGQDGALAVAVAISGGGHRAGNFGVGVLLGLEELRRPAASGGGGAGAGADLSATDEAGAGANALTEVDYLSTVSGGGLCAAAYVSSLFDHQSFGGSPEGYSLARALAAKGDKTPLAEQTTDPDLLANLQYNYVDDIIRGAMSIVLAGRFHRGDFLENSFDDRILGRLWRARKFAASGSAGPGGASRVLRTPLGGLRPYGDASLRLSDMFVSLEDASRPVRLPYWAANATTYENAAIFPFTPEHLRLYDIRGYTHRLVEIRRDDANAGAGEKAFAYEAPLAVGLTASGTFPVLIPACTLQSGMDPANPYLHLVDGGLADIFGAMTAIRMLRQDQAPRKVLIVVDAFNGPLTPFSKCDTAPAAIATAFRVATAFLDSWRARYREVITGLCSSRNPPTDIRVVFLSFDDLLECKDIKPLEPFGFGPDDLTDLCRRRLSSTKEQSPFILARDVFTWYSLTPPEQKLLFAVGRYLVDKKKDEIRQALGWAEPAGR